MSATEPIPPDSSSPGELARLRDELRLCQQELAAVRSENETLQEADARLRRARARAQREAGVLAKALAEHLYRQSLDRARRPWWRRGRSRVSTVEWQQVQILRQTDLFRPAWYLRRNLAVVERGIDPALHFLREGFREGRDPGPHFSIEDYLHAHPEVRRSGENPLLHALQFGDPPSPPPPQKKTS